MILPLHGPDKLSLSYKQDMDLDDWGYCCGIPARSIPSAIPSSCANPWLWPVIIPSSWTDFDWCSNHMFDKHVDQIHGLGDRYWHSTLTNKWPPSFWNSNKSSNSAQQTTLNTNLHYDYQWDGSSWDVCFCHTGQYVCVTRYISGGMLMWLHRIWQLQTGQCRWWCVCHSFQQVTATSVCIGSDHSSLLPWRQDTETGTNSSDDLHGDSTTHVG